MKNREPIRERTHDEDRPLEWTSEHPVFEIPEWETLDCREVGAAEMSRHFMVTGETGSGKTKSAVMPLIAAAFEYPNPWSYAAYREKVRHPEPADELRPAMLVIDPKYELADYVLRLNEQALQPRSVVLLNLREDDQRLHYFEGSDVSQSGAYDLGSRLLNVGDTYQRMKQAEDPFWVESAKDIIFSALAVDLSLHRMGGVEQISKFWNRVAFLVPDRIEAFELEAHGQPEQAIESAQAIEDVPLSYDRNNYLSAIYNLIHLSTVFHRDNVITADGKFLRGDPVIEAYVAACREFQIPAGETLRMQTLGSLPDKTYTSITSQITALLQEYASPELAKHVSLNPYEAPDRYLSVEACLNEGIIVVYTPGTHSILGDTVGRVIKSKFFELSFSRDNKVRPFVYVCDEFQRYITADRRSGEQSFLDRCRAFRGICILATQSIASLEYALYTGSPNVDIGRSALAVMLNNTGNEFFFRNTDQDTHLRLETILPWPYDSTKPHLSRVRPISTLKPGECYYILTNGEFGRNRVELESLS